MLSNSPNTVKKYIPEYERKLQLGENHDGENEENK
jgi:hypothetical protein